MSQLSPVAIRAELMQSGLTYYEAQAIMSAQTGHDLYLNDAGRVLIVDDPANASQTPETLDILRNIVNKVEDNQPAQIEPVLASPQTKETSMNLPQSVLDMPYTDSYGNLVNPSGSVSGTQTGIGDIFSGIGDSLGSLGSILPLMLIMGMFKGGSSGLSGILPMLLLLPMLGAGNSSESGGSALGQTTGFSMGNVNASQVALWAMLPKMGSIATMLLGGVSGMVGASLKPKKRSYRRSYYPRRRYYRRKY